MLKHQAFLLFVLVLLVISMACIVSCERRSRAAPLYIGGAAGVCAGADDIAQYIVPASS